MAEAIPTAGVQPLAADGDLKSAVRDFWEARPCGSRHAAAPEGTTEYFAQVERRRYELEPFIARFADFAATDDRRVLEIGVGLGTDLVRFARAGARVTGVDLTEHSIGLARSRLALEGLVGDLRRADAERLPFADGSFDVVYSWGVLHHTPDTAGAIRESIRVLAPGGRLCVMLYGRRSWVGLALWARHALLRGRPRRTVADVLAHHMESPGTKAYTRDELRTLFAGLDGVTIDQVGTPYDRRVAGPLAVATGRWMGWFMVIRGRRDPTPPADRFTPGSQAGVRSVP
jgi:SAM-dependent methyltransferase